MRTEYSERGTPETTAWAVNKALIGSLRPGCSVEGVPGSKGITEATPLGTFEKSALGGVVEDASVHPVSIAMLTESDKIGDLKDFDAIASPPRL